ncbi:MAG: PH domain-containing protein [Candidatus Hodarchaeales archaeon]
MSELPRIVGSDIPPPPGKPRIIRPSKNFLYKNYFLFILTAILFIIAMLAFVLLLSIFIGGSRGPVVEQQLNDLFLLMFVGFTVLWGIAFVIYAIGLRIYVSRMKFIVHGTEIVVIKGLINFTEKHVPYRTVTNISMRSGPFDRLFKIGTIEIQTAGGSAPSLDQTAEEKLEGITIYREVRDYILTQLRQFQKQEKGSGVIDHIASNVTETSIDQDELIRTMRDINTLLSNKFQILEDSLKEISKQLKNLDKPY